MNKLVVIKTLIRKWKKKVSNDGSPLIVVCPFCSYWRYIFGWTKKGNKCNNCGAIHYKNGQSIKTVYR